PPKVFEQYFPDVSKDVQVACLEMDLSKITEIKNKKKVGSKDGNQTKISIIKSG
ncbi:pathogenicity island protein, partial [Staphylococcus aureus]